MWGTMNVNPRIIAASLVGLGLVGGAYWLSLYRSPASTIASSSKEPAARTFIKVADQDNDGLPDWQNTLNIPTIRLDATSSEMTKTAALTAELAARTSGTGTASSAILADIGSDLAQAARDEQYTSRDISVTADNSATALRLYGNQVAAIALNNAPPHGTEDELTILNRALVRNDPAIVAELKPTIDSYNGMIEDMLQVNVPSAMVREHLALLNVYQALENDIAAFELVFTDALPAMVRFRRYQADAEALYVALNMLYLKLDKNGITWTDADVASRLIKIE